MCLTTIVFTIEATWSQSHRNMPIILPTSNQLQHWMSYVHSFNSISYLVTTTHLSMLCSPPRQHYLRPSQSRMHWSLLIDSYTYSIFITNNSIIRAEGHPLATYQINSICNYLPSINQQVALHQQLHTHRLIVNQHYREQHPAMAKLYKEQWLQASSLGIPHLIMIVLSCFINYYPFNTSIRILQS